jgi:hypothetical protein
LESFEVQEQAGAVVLSRILDRAGLCQVVPATISIAEPTAAFAGRYRQPTTMRQALDRSRSPKPQGVSQ